MNVFVHCRVCDGCTAAAEFQGAHSHSSTGVPTGSQRQGHGGHCTDWIRQNTCRKYLLLQSKLKRKRTERYSLSAWKGFEPRISGSFVLCRRKLLLTPLSHSICFQPSCTSTISRTWREEMGPSWVLLIILINAACVYLSWAKTASEKIIKLPRFFTVRSLILIWFFKKILLCRGLEWLRFTTLMFPNPSPPVLFSVWSWLQHVNWHNRCSRWRTTTASHLESRAPVCMEEPLRVHRSET